MTFFLNERLPGPLIDLPELTPEEREALALVVHIAFEGAQEYGFSNPEYAREVWAAARLLAPDLEPQPPSKEPKSAE